MGSSRGLMAALCALQKRHSTMNLHNLAGIKCEQAREKAKVSQILSTYPDQEDPMLIFEMSAVVEQMQEWRRLLPNVRPFYAVKCNNSPELLGTMVALESGFDCASKEEIRQMIEMGVDPKDIVFANPCKQVSHIQFAREAGVKMTTLDSVGEVEKLREHWPEAEVLLRIATDDSAAICQFSSKFGATLDLCPQLVKEIKKQGLKMIGVSFHVGSGCTDGRAFVDAAHNAKIVFEMAKREGFEMRVLDIGGGFPGDCHSSPTFEEIAVPLKQYLDEHFPGIELIAEPGRYFACRSVTIATNVFGKRVIESHRDLKHQSAGSEPVQKKESELEYQYYVNDGTYQSFNCIYFDHVVAHPYPLPWDPINNRPRGATQRVTKESLVAEHPGEGEYCTTIFGPTCDALDCIAKRVNFPALEVGDWVYFANMGAYTCSAASAFNGFFSWRRVTCSTADYQESGAGTD